MSAATMKITRTLPAAFASAYSPRMASGSTTSWTQRGTTTRGGPFGRRGGESAGSGSCACGAASGGTVSGVPFTFLPPSAEYG